MTSDSIRPSSGRFLRPVVSFSSSISSRRGRDSVVFSPTTATTMTSLRNANWKAEGTVHVRDYLPRSATTDVSAIYTLIKILYKLTFINLSRLRHFVHREGCSVLSEQRQTPQRERFYRDPITESLRFSLRNTRVFTIHVLTECICMSFFLSPSILITLFRNPIWRSRLCDTWQTRQSCTLNRGIFPRFTRVSLNLNTRSSRSQQVAKC